jgi:hypothetical protein
MRDRDETSPHPDRASLRSSNSAVAEFDIQSGRSQATPDFYGDRPSPQEEGEARASRSGDTRSGGTLSRFRDPRGPEAWERCRLSNNEGRRGRPERPAMTARSAPLKKGAAQTDRPDLPRAALKLLRSTPEEGSPNPWRSQQNPRTGCGPDGCFQHRPPRVRLRGLSREPRQLRVLAFGHPPEPQRPQCPPLPRAGFAMSSPIDHDASRARPSGTRCTVYTAITATIVKHYVSDIRFISVAIRGTAAEADEFACYSKRRK